MSSHRVSIQSSDSQHRTNIPIQFGLNLQPGQAQQNYTWTMFSEVGQAFPTQSRTLESHLDGSSKLVQIVFILDYLESSRELTCTPDEFSPTDRNAILTQKSGHFYFQNAHLKTVINNQGQMTSLVYQNRELLAEPTSLLSVANYQNTPRNAPLVQHKVDDHLNENCQEVHIIEAGPVRAILESNGTLQDSDLHYVHRFTFYHDLNEITIESKVLNVGSPQYLRAWTYEWRFNTPPQASVINAEDFIFDHLVDVNLTGQTLTANSDPAGIQFSYNNEINLGLQSPDFARYANGLIALTHLEGRPEICQTRFHRTEPLWHYRGITSHHPIEHLLFLEGQRRAASCTLTFGDTHHIPKRTQNLSRTIAVRSDTSVNKSESLTSSQWRNLKKRVLDRALTFVIPHGEYQGLFAGGRCHTNNRLIEYGVSRADYAEYLWSEYKRSNNPQLFEATIQYAERFIDTAIFRSQNDPQSHGAVRHRFSENKPNQVRSMRGPTFLLDVYLYTGRETFRDTALEIGEYLLRSFPDLFARQGAVCRELAYLYAFTNDTRFHDKTFDVLSAVQASQLPSGAWYEHFTQDGQSAEIDVFQAGLYTKFATEKPEMSSYNIVGMIDAGAYLDLSSYTPMIEKATTWLRDVQDSEGAWRFPSWDSAPQWGHGLFQDTLAMLKAYQFFGDKDYLIAADRSIIWAEKTWDKWGYIPSVTTPSPHNRLEASLVYFYGLEALSLREEIERQNQ